MSLREKINEDLKQAMRDKDAVKRTVLRGVLSAFKEAEESKREELVRNALKTNGVERPQKTRDMEEEEYTEILREFGKTVDSIVASENIEEKSKLDQTAMEGLILKMVKQRQDAVNEAEGAGRSDIAENEKAEIPILEVYLPEMMSREEIEKIVRAQIEKVGASDPKDMGKVMGPVMGQLKGKADGSLVNQIVRELLSS